MTLNKWLTVGAFVGFAALQGSVPSDAQAYDTRKAGQVVSVDGNVTENIVLQGPVGAVRARDFGILNIGAYNDPRRLRVDINLAAPYSGKRAIYAFKVGGSNFEETYAFAPARKTFHYRKKVNDAVVDNKEIPMTPNGDYATLGTRLGVPNQLVVLYIDKDKHFGGVKGTELTLLIQAFSGEYVNDVFHSSTKIINETDKVLLSYIR